MVHNPYVQLLTFFLLSIFQSCSFGSKNTSLGNDFKLNEFSHKETQIMYCFDDGCNSGYTVIPNTVIAYNFDDNWIIAKSDSNFDNQRNDFAYWIFKKNFSSKKENMYDSIKTNLIGPLDSATFYKMLPDKSIQLQLIKYK
jgi:hypothetical protein